LYLTALSVAACKRKGVTGVPLSSRDGQRGGGVEPAREEDDGARAHHPPRRAPQSITWRRGEKRKPWRAHASATHGLRAIRSSRRTASGWSRMRPRGSAKRSASLSTSATSPSSATTNFHQGSAGREARVGRGG